MAPLDMVLASGGRDADMFSPPGPPGLEYRIGTIAHGDYRLDPEAWIARATRHEEPWWPVWTNSLEACPSERVDSHLLHAPNVEHQPLLDAPGTYVLMR